MIKLPNFYYESATDSLSIFLKKARKTHDVKINDNLIFVRSDKNNEIVGIEILSFSKLDKEKLNEQMPTNIDLMKLPIQDYSRDVLNIHGTYSMNVLK